MDDHALLAELRDALVACVQECLRCETRALCERVELRVLEHTSRVLEDGASRHPSSVGPSACHAPPPPGADKARVPGCMRSARTPTPPPTLLCVNERAIPQIDPQDGLPNATSANAANSGWALRRVRGAEQDQLRGSEGDPSLNSHGSQGSICLPGQAVDEREPTKKYGVSFSDQLELEPITANPSDMQDDVAHRSQCPGSSTSPKTRSAYTSMVEAMPSLRGNKRFRGFKWTVRGIDSRLTTRSVSLTMRQQLLKEQGTGYGRFRSKVCEFVLHPYFETVVGILVALNVCTLSWQVQHYATNATEQMPSIFSILEVCFCVVFALELVMKMVAHGCSFFSVCGWQWNLFDLLVVSSQIVELSLSMHLEQDGPNFSLVRMLRLGRIVRVLRIVRAVPELKSMVYLIAASMESFVWCVTLLIIMIFGFSVYFTELVADHQNQCGTDAWEERNECEQDFLNGMSGKWGSIDKSILTLYQAITGGDDWSNASTILSDISGISLIVFAAYIAFATLVMLNLVTGVFVESAQRYKKKDGNTELVFRLRQVFGGEAHQEITWEEFKERLHTEEMTAYCSRINISADQAEQLFRILDRDKSGLLSVHEFVRGCVLLKGPARAVDLGNLMCSFDSFVERADKHMRSVERMLEATRVEGPPAVCRTPGQKPQASAAFCPPGAPPEHYRSKKRTSAPALSEDDSSEEDNLT